MNRETSQLISLLRIQLVLFVITIHIGGIDSKFIECFVGFISRGAVPLFFIISGYLFFTSKLDYKTKIKKRVWSLVIPFYVWNFIAIIYNITIVQLGFASTQNFYKSATITEIIISFLGLFHTYPSDIPMWYVRNLFIVCCLSPLIIIILKKVPRFFLLFCVLIYILDNSKFTYIVIQTILFFSLGMYIAMKRIVLDDIFKLQNTIIVILCIMVSVMLWFFLRNNDIANIISRIGSLCTIYLISCFLYNLAQRDISISKKSILLEASFFIFAFHDISLSGICSRINTYFIVDYNNIGKIVVFMVEVLTIYIASLGLFCVLRKYCPKLLYIMNGR